MGLSAMGDNDLAVKAEENGFESIRLLVDHIEKGRIERRPGLEIYTTDIQFFLFNGVLGSALAEDSHAIVDETVAEMKTRGLPFTWMVGPTATPARLGNWLEKNGLRPVDNPIMAVDISRLRLQPDAAHVKIVEVTGTDDMAEWAATLSSGTAGPLEAASAMAQATRRIHDDQPGVMRSFLARIEGEPVGTSSVFVAAGVAGVYNVCTVESARRKGVGTAVTAAALRAAKADGRSTAILFASTMGYPVYEKMGFRMCCPFTMYIWSG